MSQMCYGLKTGRRISIRSQMFVESSQR